MSQQPDAIARTIEKVINLRNEVDDHWQIPADEAQLLAQLVRIGNCRSICEIGTSYGFSTLHLAWASTVTGGHVHTIDLNPKKTQAATQHLKEAGLLSQVTLHTGDAREVIKQLQPEEPFDFVFIDAVKAQSGEYLQAVLPKLSPRAVLVTDNTTTHWSELETFVKQLRGMSGSTSCGVSVGNGFELTVLTR